MGEIVTQPNTKTWHCPKKFSVRKRRNASMTAVVCVHDCRQGGRNLTKCHGKGAWYVLWNESKFAKQIMWLWSHNNSFQKDFFEPKATQDYSLCTADISCCHTRTGMCVLECKCSSETIWTLSRLYPVCPPSTKSRLCQLWSPVCRVIPPAHSRRLSFLL